MLGSARLRGEPTRLPTVPHPILVPGSSDTMARIGPTQVNNLALPLNCA